MTNKSYQYQFQVSLYDTDAAGVMFFSHLFRHAHDAYEQFLSDIGFSLKNMLYKEHHHMPLVHAEADYLLPIRHADKVQVQMQVDHLGENSFSVHYTFTNEEGNLLATARTAHVLLESDSNTKLPLPEDLKDALARHARAG